MPQINIKGKIMLGFFVVLVLMVGLYAYLIYVMKVSDNNYNLLINRNAYAYADSQAALAIHVKAGEDLMTYVMFGDPAAKAGYKQDIATGDTYFDKARDLLTDSRSKSLFEVFSKNADVFEGYAGQAISLVEAAQAATGPAKAAAMNDLNAYVAAHKGTVVDMVNAGVAFGDYESLMLKNGNAANRDQAGKATRLAIMLVILVVIISLLFAYVIASMITRPFSLLDAKAAKIAAGDLTDGAIRLDSGDEAGRLAASFNTMQANLKEIIQALQQKSVGLSSLAGELSSGAESLAHGVSTTTGTITQVAATVDHLNGSTQQIAAASLQAAGYAREGNEKLDSFMARMDAIRQAAVDSEGAVRALGQTADKISEVLASITSIADQTNLLSLNAAIESARAGEYGRGFGVVAAEVRSLAQEASEAAKHISDMVAVIRENAGNAMASMAENAAQVGSGVSVIAEARGIFERITSSVASLGDEIQRIAAASGEMTAVVENVVTSAQDQTAGTEEVAAGTQDLAEMARQMDALAARFKLG